MAGGCALLLWVFGVLFCTFFFEPTASVVVIGPRSAARAVSEAEEAAIVDEGPTYTRVISLRAGYVRSLYANGAWLVWPMIDAGCIGLSS